MAGNWINEALTVLDEQMGQNYAAYVDTILGGWMEAFGNSNSGQQSIISYHMWPAALAHCQEARYRWPYGSGADEYYEAMYSAYDASVVEMCFSDTINAQYDECAALKQEASDWQLEHEYLVDIIGSVLEPHSMDPDWVGSRTA